MDLKNFDLFGLYPKPISEMKRSTEVLFSAFITVALVLGIISIVMIAAMMPKVLLISSLIVVPLVVVVYAVLTVAKKTCSTTIEEEKSVNKHSTT